MQSASIPMTPRQVALVQESFAKIVPIREQAAALFYDRLFAIDPSTRPLFRGDMKSQGAKLMAAIGAVVKSLDRIDTMLDDLRTLARRHHRYGVREVHYASVGAALLWTLEQGLGVDFTPDVRRAWATAYDLLSGAMIAVSSVKGPPIPAVALQLDCQHSAGPELLRDALTSPKIKRHFINH
jgi:hemoglobin-like flavoprotein